MGHEVEYGEGQGGLSAATLTHDPEDATFFEGKIYAVNRLEDDFAVMVIGTEIPDLNDISRHRAAIR